MAGSDKTTDHDHNRTTSLDEVLAAYAELEANRGAVDCEAFIAKYPALEAELREFFADKEMLDEFVPPDGGSSNGSNQLTEMFMGSVLGRFELRRRRQAREWMLSLIGDYLEHLFYQHPDIIAQMPDIEQAVMSGKLPPTAAARQLLQIFEEALKSDR